MQNFIEKYICTPIAAFLVWNAKEIRLRISRGSKETQVALIVAFLISFVAVIFSHLLLDNVV